MLNKKDNPELFKILYIECLKRGHNLKANTKVLKDEWLQEIKELDLTQYFKLPLNSLVGIENLTNLEKFNDSGYSFTIYLEEVIREGKKFYEQEKLDIYLDHVDKLEKHQIKDISPILKLSNLKYLTLDNQRYIKEINLSSLKNLESLSMQKCNNLNTIKGLNDIVVGKQLESYNVFDFSGCNKLYNIENFPELVKKLGICASGYCYGKFTFPTKTYCYLKNHYKNKLPLDDARLDKILSWSEISTFYVRNDFSTTQMYYTKIKLDKIIKSICKKSQSDIEKIHSVYDWICKNIKYDNYGSAKEETIDIGYSYINDNNFISNNIRSSYKAFWDKTAVCTGISALLNFMLADLGFKTDSICCLTRYFNRDSSLANIGVVASDHEISAIDLHGEKYYFDPTADLCDLPTDKFSYFMLNKYEMSKNVYFRYYEQNQKDSPSMQSYLAKNGFNIEYNFNKDTGKYQNKIGYEINLNNKYNNTLDYLKDTIDKRDYNLLKLQNGKNTKEMLNKIISNKNNKIKMEKEL